MGRLATVSLRDHVSHELLVDVVRLMRGEPLGFVHGPPLCLEDDEVEPFLDWDATRGHGAGFFCGDARECRSRRVDLRGPTDVDPGPLPMEEAPEDITARHLIFQVGRRSAAAGPCPDRVTTTRNA